MTNTNTLEKVFLRISIITTINHQAPGVKVEKHFKKVRIVDIYHHEKRHYFAAENVFKVDFACKAYVKVSTPFDIPMEGMHF